MYANRVSNKQIQNSICNNSMEEKIKIKIPIVKKMNNSSKKKKKNKLLFFLNKKVENIRGRIRKNYSKFISKEDSHRW